MPANYTQKMLRCFSQTSTKGLKSFIDSAGLQLRAPLRTKYAPETTASFLESSFINLLLGMHLQKQGLQVQSQTIMMTAS